MNEISQYKGGKFSETIIKFLLLYLKKVQKNGLKKTIETTLYNFNLEDFVLKKIEYQLAKRRNIKFQKWLGSVNIQYRFGGIRIEPVGFLRLIFKDITITNNQLVEILDSLLKQIEEKYIKNTKYIEKKADEIITQLNETGIYKPETAEEKTLYDFILLILVDLHKITNEQHLPVWIETAMNDVAEGKFIEEWLHIVLEQVFEVISSISKNIFFDFKITFNSRILRAILNKKTNRGQLYKLFEILKIDIKKIIYKFSKSYISPSFTKGIGEIIRGFAVSLLCDINSNFNFEEDEKIDEKKDIFNITLTFGENVQNSRALRWYTKKEITSGFVEIAENESFENSTKIKTNHRIVPKMVPIFNLGLMTNYKPQYFSEFSAEMINLKEGTYFYKIIYENFQSEIFKFEVKNSENDLKFAIFADSQGMIKDDYDVFLNVFESALNHGKKPNFAIHLGDFVDDGNNEHYWQWLLASNAWHENAVVPLVGNHDVLVNTAAAKIGTENSVISHFNIKNIPKNQNLNQGVYYSFVYGAATFVALNTNSQDDNMGLDKTQYKWALNVLKSAKTPWRIILAHKFPYSNGPHSMDHDVRTIGKQIEALAYEGQADLVLGAHDHVYVRTQPLALGNRVSSGNGTVFIIPGTSGVKNYKQNLKIDVPAEVKFNLNLPVFSEIKITPNSIIFSAYTVENSNIQKIDAHTIKKNNFSADLIDSETVERYIDEIPEVPWIDHSARIETAIKFYESLDYQEKIDVKNFSKLQKIKKMNESNNKILSGEIKTVNNKKEFLNAISDPKVGTIITNCNEIIFENRFGKKNVITISRNLCIRGCAKLSFVKFVVKNNSMLILADKVCIDNIRLMFSLYPKLPAFETEYGSEVVLKDKTTVWN